MASSQNKRAGEIIRRLRAFLSRHEPEVSAQPVEETVRSFREVLDGQHDDVPEGAFLLKGSIDDVVEASRGS